MNFGIICGMLGSVLWAEGAVMTPALVLAIIRHENSSALGFAVAMAAAGIIGFLLRSVRSSRKEFYAREGFVTVGLAWIVLSVFGCLPFLISGAIPSFIDSFFETVSGFTTTGASILTDIEALPMSLLYWRSFTNWLGGMGVLVFVLAFGALSSDSGDAMYILRAESPGVKVGKLVPRMRQSTALLYLIYVGITIIMIVLLAFDMPFFDALTISFATAGTGGFAIKNASIALYSPYAQTVITIFMMLFSVNFTVYFMLLLRQFKDALKNEELWTFLGIFAAAVLAITFNILPVCQTFGTALHQAAFTVSSIISTTGFSISDYDKWPEFSRMILVLLMFIGACAGSTGGGFKIVRVVLVAKITKRGIRQAIHPREIRSIHLDGRTVDEDTVRSVTGFTFLYMICVVICLILVSLNGLDFTTTFSSVASCFNNVGPALGLAGPALNYTCFNSFSRLVLSFAMLFGRLELFPMLVLFTKATWQK